MPKVLSIREKSLLQKVVTTNEDVMVPHGHTWVITGLYVLPGPGYQPPSAAHRDATQYGDIWLCIGDRIVHQMNAMTLMDSWYIRSVSRVADLRAIIEKIDDPSYAQVIMHFAHKNPHLVEPMRWMPVHIPGGLVLSFRRDNGKRISDPLQVEVWIDHTKPLP